MSLSRNLRSSFQKLLILVCSLCCLILPFAPAFSWPSADEWNPVYRAGAIITDPNNDATGPRNVVSDPNHAALFIFNDSSYLYFRMRLDQDPAGTGGQGLLKSFGWGILIDTNLNAGDYEWMIMLDGISQNENISLRQNTIQGNLGDPSDVPEVTTATIPLAGNFQINLADTSFNGDQDYFLDWRFPYSILLSVTGITGDSPIRYYGGTSPSANNLTQSGGDLIGASDLYAGFSDYMTPFGTRPTTGVIRFVENLAGNGDVTEVISGQTLYLRVGDGDQNYNMTTLQTVTVTLTTTNGDSVTTSLTETGVNTGIFTGYVLTTYGLPLTNNGILEISTGETITATYLDKIDANINLNQYRTDSVIVLGPTVTVSKTVNLSEVSSGETVIYTITVNNTGTAAAVLSSIQDLLPSGFIYVPGSSAGLTNSDPTINGQILTWGGNWVIPKENLVTLSFKALAGGVSGTFYNSVTVSGNNFPFVTTGDTAPVTVGAPIINLVKQVNKTTAIPGEEIIYTVYYTNLGTAGAKTLVIMDSIPANTTYVTGSLRQGSASSSYDTAVPLTDSQDGDSGYVSNGMVFFTILTVE
ncbi:MAG: hypothetical protein NC911_09275, partial [Candidatus Omnitrophica bacterium]|nr:hypothetical protein [Candidatus Omnitrophota bacterium]